MPNENLIPEKKIKHNLPPIPEAMKRAMETERYYIFNVGPWSHNVSMGTMGNFHVPACPEGAKVSEALKFQGKPGIPTIVPQSIVSAVEGTRVVYDWDFKTEGLRVAKNIMGQTGFASPEANLENYGVFLAAGPVPTEAEIEAANEKLNDLLDKRVREADRAFEVNGGMEMGENGKPYSAITRDHIYACNRLGLDRPWARKNAKMVPCEGCGQSVSPNAVRCPHAGCGAILNEEKARRLFPHLYAHEVVEPEKRGPGRPPKVAA